eukprot:SAG31_NODE_1863_length_7037_cov_2.325742_2_plen_444_part_00
MNAEVGRRQGHRPNIWWRAVSGDALRTGRWPDYIGLPPVESLLLSSQRPAEWRFIRQDSLLWSTLHWGVLTSRNLPAFLGLLEPAAAKTLGMGRHMVNHNRMVEAVEELRAAAEWRAAHEAQPGCPATAAFAFEQAGVPDSDATSDATKVAAAKANRAACQAFAASAVKKPAPVHQYRAWRGQSVSPLRTSWGSVHEGTALACYLGHLNSGSVAAIRPPSQRLALLREVGLVMLDTKNLPESCCPSGVDLSAICLGASPDALLGYSANVDSASASAAAAAADNDGLGGWEPIEVKCICPWGEPHHQTEKRQRRNGRFILNHSQPHEKLPVHAVVQTQLEMLCCGSKTCKLLSYTAHNGMNVLHLERDDEFCAMMLRVASMVCHKYVVGDSRHVPVNALSDTAAHVALVRRTARLRSALRIENVIPTPATPVNAAGGNLFLEDG